MILDCVVETEASLVICHAEHVFAFIAFQERDKEKTQSGEIQYCCMWTYVPCVYVFCVCLWTSSAVRANIESCSIVR